MRENRFITQLKKQLSIIKRIKNRKESCSSCSGSAMQEMNTSLAKHQIKSSSKSTKKSRKSYPQDQCRKSKRGKTQKIQEDEQLLQIDKEPLWNIKKANYENDLGKQDFIPKKNRFTEVITRKRKSMSCRKNMPEESPAYEFEGLGYIEPLSKIKISVEHEDRKVEQRRLLQQAKTKTKSKKIAIKQTKSKRQRKLEKKEHKENKFRVQEKQQQIRKKLLESQYFQGVSCDHKQKIDDAMQINQVEQAPIDINQQLSKRDQSLLQIIKIIDDFFAFQKAFRPQKAIKCSDIISYVSDAKGYFFNKEMLNTITIINPNLYTVFTISRITYIKCGHLSPQEISRRQSETRKILIKKPININFVRSQSYAS